MFSIENSKKMQSVGFIVLRTGLALVFVWFGVNQLMNPSAWTSFVPYWGIPPFLNATQVVLINGLFEVLSSILLILNIFTRPVAFLLFLHLIGIAIPMGLSPTGVRDFGLCISTFALFLLGERKE